MKKIAALFLVLVMIFSCFAFASCEKGGNGKENEKDEQTDSGKDGKKNEGNGKTDKDGYLSGDVSDLIKGDPLEIPDDAKALYEGKTFTIDSPTPWGRDRFIRDDLNDDPLNDSIYNMNVAVLDKIGVKLDATMNTSTDKQATVFIDSVLSGDHKFDVMAVHTQSNCASLVIADAVLNFDYLENIDLSKPWWNPKFTEQTSILGVNYFGVSSSCYAIYLNTVVLLFNKDLAEERNLPDLYELVRRGEWTVDKMIELTKNFSQDLNNDGIYDSEDRLAMVSDNGPHINAWLGAFRQNTVIRGEKDEPQIVVNSSRVSNIVDKLNTLYNTGRRTVIYRIYEREFGDDLYNKAFAEGRVLFDIAYIDVATKLRDYDINYGIIPMPKLSLDQDEYGSYVEAWHLCYAVPKDCPDPEYTSTVLETMAYYSYHLTYPAILRQVIYGTGTRDSESSEMLDLIFKNMNWDFGYVYNGHSTGYAGILSSLISVGSTDIASYIAEKQKIVEKFYEDLYDAAINNAEK